jgi:hypothetical protein
VIKARMTLAALLLVMACRHNSEDVQPHPEPRWVDVGKVCTPESPAYPLPESLRDTSAKPFGTAHKDWDEKAELSRTTIPGGWGGIGFRRERYPRTTVYLLDTLQFEGAVRALVAAGLLPPNPSVAPVQGRWTYAQLYDWFKYIHMNIRGVAVTGWAFDESRNRSHGFGKHELQVPDSDCSLLDDLEPGAAQQVHELAWLDLSV